MAEATRRPDNFFIMQVGRNKSLSNRISRRASCAKSATRLAIRRVGVADNYGGGTSAVCVSIVRVTAIMLGDD